MLRIARTKKSTYLSEENPNDQHFAQYQQLIKLIKKHLSPVTASIFAQPVLQENSDDIEWYSDLNGQPESLLSLSDDEQLKAKRLLSDRLAALTKLADQLAELEPGSEQSQALLKKAVQFPGDNSVYVINDQPVITFWGVPDPTQKSIKADNTPSPQTGQPAVASKTNGPGVLKSGPSRLVITLIALSLILAAFISWWLFFHKDPFELLVERFATANCVELAVIEKDPVLRNTEEPRFEILRQKLKRKLEDCSYNKLKVDIKSAEGNCNALDLLLGVEPLRTSPMPRFTALREQAAKALEDCRYQAMKEKIRTASCSKAEVLLKGWKDSPMSAPQAAQLRKKLRTKIVDCRQKYLSTGDNNCAKEFQKWKKKQGFSAWYQGPEADYCGFSWGWKSPSIAKKAALRKCKEFAKGNTCILIVTKGR